MTVNWGSFNMAMLRAVGTGGGLGLGTAAATLPEWAAQGTTGLVGGLAVAGASAALGAAGGLVYSWKRTDNPQDRFVRLVDGKPEPRHIARRLQDLVVGKSDPSSAVGPRPVCGKTLKVTYTDSVSRASSPVRLHYYEAGKQHKAKGTLILLHGFASHAYQWNQIFDELAEHYHVIALDLPGHGYSDCIDGHDYDFITTLPDLLNQFLDALGLTGVTVVGSSLGGGVGQQWAWGNEERIKQLIIFDSSGCSGRIEPVPIFIEMARLPLAFQHAFILPRFLDELMVTFALWRYVHPTADTISPFDVTQFALPYQFDAQKTVARGIYGDMIRGLSVAIEPQRIYQDRQRSIQQPTLYVYSEWDKTVRPSIPKAITSDIPNSQLLWIPESEVPTAGHTLMSDTPQLALQILLDVLASDGKLLTVSGKNEEQSHRRFLLRSAGPGKYRYTPDFNEYVESIFQKY